MLMIRSPHRPLEQIGGAPELSDVQKLLPSAHAVEPRTSADHLWDVLDSNGDVIARTARTLPAAANVVGYRGPSESLILFNKNLQIIGVSLLASSDTEEHVDAVLRDESFFDQFREWKWGGLKAEQKVDGVSGATLTSLAIAGGVLKRIGGDKPSLVFESPTEPSEIAEWFPKAKSLRQISASTSDVLDEKGQVLGSIVRTGPLSDSIVGYQGPTELLLQLSKASVSSDQPEGDAIVKAARIRKSFDNEPYVDYVRTEYGFWPLFQDKTMKQLAEMDLVAEEVEGVSGATMTSMAVAETLVKSAGAHLVEKPISANKNLGWFQSLVQEVRISSVDIATVVVLLLAFVSKRLGLFRVQWMRRIWLILVVVVIGWWSGNLISMALLSGWGAEGIAWKLAPALALLAAIAFLSPPLTKSNPYCNHLCPHGAIQQLIKPSQKSRRKWSPARWLTRLLTYMPGVTLVIAYICLVIAPTSDLSSWEPFHAYLINIAGWGALALALGTLAFSAFVPMGYCRFGCPTGRLLDYVRRKATSDRIRIADGVALGLLAVAWWAGRT